jgi:Mlc titration factor MtfA (ptsG expression regulator)
VSAAIPLGTDPFTATIDTIVALGLLLVGGLLVWLAWSIQRVHQRAREARAAPFPADWLSHLHRNVGCYQLLPPAEQARLRDDLRVFIAEKHWEGCGGLELTNEMKVTIAALACILTLGMTGSPYGRVQTILVYPAGYRDPRPRRVPGSIIHTEGVELTGEAHYRGPVVLSWEEVLRDGRRPQSGRNLVWHEFAHQLDMLDGMVDGTPPLDTPEERREWQQVMSAEYRKLVRASDEGQATLLDQYGATDEAEFFAVATESFFGRPAELARRHPRLYAVLRGYYRQDPAARVPPPAAAENA